MSEPSTASKLENATPPAEAIKKPAEQPAEGPDRIGSIEEAEAALKAASEDMGQVEQKSKTQMENLGSAVASIPEGSKVNQEAVDELGASRSVKTKELMDVLSSESEQEFSAVLEKRSEEADWTTTQNPEAQLAAGLATQKKNKEDQAIDAMIESSIDSTGRPKKETKGEAPIEIAASELSSEQTAAIEAAAAESETVEAAPESGVRLKKQEAAPAQTNEEIDLAMEAGMQELMSRQKTEDIAKEAAQHPVTLESVNNAFLKIIDERRVSSPSAVSNEDLMKILGRTQLTKEEQAVMFQAKMDLMKKMKEVEAAQAAKARGAAPAEVTIEQPTASENAEVMEAVAMEEAAEKPVTYEDIESAISGIVTERGLPDPTAVSLDQVAQKLGRTVLTKEEKGLYVKYRLMSLSSSAKPKAEVPAAKGAHKPEETKKTEVVTHDLAGFGESRTEIKPVSEEEKSDQEFAALLDRRLEESEWDTAQAPETSKSEEHEVDLSELNADAAASAEKSKTLVGVPAAPGSAEGKITLKGAPPSPEAVAAEVATKNEILSSPSEEEFVIERTAHAGTETAAAKPASAEAAPAPMAETGPRGTVRIAETAPPAKQEFGPKGTLRIAEQTPATTPEFGPKGTVRIAEVAPGSKQEFGPKGTLRMAAEAGAAAAVATEAIAATAPESQPSGIELAVSPAQLAAERGNKEFAKRLEDIRKTKPDEWSDAYYTSDLNWTKGQWEMLSSEVPKGEYTSEKSQFRVLRMADMENTQKRTGMETDLRSIEDQIKQRTAELRAGQTQELKLGAAGMQDIMNDLQREANDKLLQSLESQKKQKLMEIRKIDEMTQQQKAQEKALQTKALDRLKNKSGESAEDEVDVDVSELGGEAAAEKTAEAAVAAAAAKAAENGNVESPQTGESPYRTIRQAPTPEALGIMPQQKKSWPTWAKKGAGYAAFGATLGGAWLAGKAINGGLSAAAWTAKLPFRAFAGSFDWAGKALGGIDKILGGIQKIITSDNPASAITQTFSEAVNGVNRKLEGSLSEEERKLVEEKRRKEATKQEAKRKKEAEPKI